MIEEILPAEVISAEASGEHRDVELFAEEEALLTRAVGKLRREFGTVRMCARYALGQLGLPPSPLLPGERGAPRWPDGIVGSMTHCTGYCAAAVARDSEVHTIGIDAEPHDVLPDGVERAITADGEQSHLAELRAGDDTVAWDRLLFCAKESVYKAWFPLTGLWLGFQDAAITLDPDRQTFAARLLIPPPDAVPNASPLFTGRWLVRDGLAITTIAIPASERSRLGIHESEIPEPDGA